MFDLERFRILLRGEDSPKNTEEQSWLDNYYKNQRLSGIKYEEREHQIHQNIKNAYSEYIEVLSKIIPQDFFCKNPISIDEYISLKDAFKKKVSFKVKLYMHSPMHFLQNPRHSDHMNAYISNCLFNEYSDEEICKYFGISYNTMATKYKSYITDDAKVEIEAIHTKYGIPYFGGLEFNLKDWCTDYAEYRDYKA